MIYHSGPNASSTFNSSYCLIIHSSAIVKPFDISLPSPQENVSQFPGYYLLLLLWLLGRRIPLGPLCYQPHPSIPASQRPLATLYIWLFNVIFSLFLFAILIFFVSILPFYLCAFHSLTFLIVRFVVYIPLQFTIFKCSLGIQSHNQCGASEAAAQGAELQGWGKKGRGSKYACLPRVIKCLLTIL